MFGGSWASPRLLWLPQSEHSPRSPYVSPSPVLQAGKLLQFPRGKSELTGLGPYGSRDWKLGTAAQNDFTPKPRDAQPRARWYLEISRDGFDGTGLKGLYRDQVGTVSGLGSSETSFSAWGSPVTESYRSQKPTFVRWVTMQKPQMVAKGQQGTSALGFTISPEV